MERGVRVNEKQAYRHVLEPEIPVTFRQIQFRACFSQKSLFASSQKWQNMENYRAFWIMKQECMETNGWRDNFRV
jgi:hypothetical protein